MVKIMLEFVCLFVNFIPIAHNRLHMLVHKYLELGRNSGFPVFILGRSLFLERFHRQRQYGNSISRISSVLFLSLGAYHVACDARLEYMQYTIKYYVAVSYTHLTLPTIYSV